MRGGQQLCNGTNSSCDGGGGGERVMPSLGRQCIHYYECYYIMLSLCKYIVHIRYFYYYYYLNELDNNERPMIENYSVGMN